MDFVSDSLANGRRIKCLTVADDFSHECVDIAVDYGISGQYVTRLLDRAARLPRLPAGRAHRQRPGVHQPGLHGLGADPRHPPHPDRAGPAHAERLHRELQRQVPGRVPERALVRDAAAGQDGHRDLAAGLQRGQAAQQLPANAAGASSPSCIASALAMQLDPPQPPPRSINLATPDFLFMNGTATGGRSARRCGEDECARRERRRCWRN